MGAKLNASHVPYREWGTVYSVGMGSRKVIVALGALAALSVATGGCRLGGSMSTETALNQLRAENAALKEKAARAEGEAAELRAKLEGSRKEIATLPVCTRIEIGDLSGPSKDGTTVDLLVKTLDGRGRFVPVAAEISAGVTKGPLRALRFDADQVREMYRSGVMGTYYLVQFPASRWAPGDVIAVEVKDLVTGKKHEADWKLEK